MKPGIERMMLAARSEQERIRPWLDLRQELLGQLDQAHGALDQLKIWEKIVSADLQTNTIFRENQHHPDRNFLRDL